MFPSVKVTLFLEMRAFQYASNALKPYESFKGL